MTLLTALSAARNAAHDAAAIIGLLAGSTGAVVSGLDAVGIHVSDVNAAHIIAIAGLAITVASKAIDSLNDALKGSTVPLASVVESAPITATTVVVPTAPAVPTAAGGGLPPEPAA